MQQINLHQHKLFAIIEALLALVALFLTWYTAGMEGYPQFDQPKNGWGSWGLLTAAGIIGVVIFSLLGDKTKTYDPQTKMIVIGCFAAVALGAIIMIFRCQAASGPQVVQGYNVTAKATPGPGLWMALVAGVIGMAWVSGLLEKLSAPRPAVAPAPSAPTTGSHPLPPPPANPPSNPY